jgi:hypothetical protein
MKLASSTTSWPKRCNIAEYKRKIAELERKVAS